VLCWCKRTTCSTRIWWKSCLHRRHLKIHEELCKLQVHLTFDCHPEFVVFVDCLRLPNLHFLPVWRLAQPLHQRKKAQFNNNLKYNEREYNYITLELWIVNLFQEYHHPRQSQLQLEIQLNRLWFLYYGGGQNISSFTFNASWELRYGISYVKATLFIDIMTSIIFPGKPLVFFSKKMLVNLSMYRLHDILNT
jgi:hypothetical protein